MSASSQVPGIPDRDLLEDEWAMQEMFRIAGSYRLILASDLTRRRNMIGLGDRYRVYHTDVAGTVVLERYDENNSRVDGRRLLEIQWAPGVEPNAIFFRLPAPVRLEPKLRTKALEYKVRRWLATALFRSLQAIAVAPEPRNAVQVPRGAAWVLERDVNPSFWLVFKPNRYVRTYTKSNLARWSGRITQVVLQEYERGPVHNYTIREKNNGMAQVALHGPSTRFYSTPGGPV